MDPQSLKPGTAMPTLGLSQDEANQRGGVPVLDHAQQRQVACGVAAASSSRRSAGVELQEHQLGGEEVLRTSRRRAHQPRAWPSPTTTTAGRGARL